jgi:hypothetical protein
LFHLGLLHTIPHELLRLSENKILKRKLLILLGIVISIPILFVLALLFYPRPTNLTPAHVYEGSTQAINYCELPVLDGSGLMAHDIPQGHTPDCGYEVFPKPILAACTEPLAEEAIDMRGLWMANRTDGSSGHIERIEQCGNRYVVTSSGVVHDLTTDGDFSGASNDVRPISLGSANFCIRTSATTQWIDGGLQFYAMGLVPVVKRYLEDNVLKWEYPGQGTTSMNRICSLPE